jgi:hypothetical protein
MWGGVQIILRGGGAIFQYIAFALWEFCSWEFTSWEFCSMLSFLRGCWILMCVCVGGGGGGEVLAISNEEV